MKRLIALLVFGLLLAGCTQYGNTTPPGGQNTTPPGNGSTVTVHISNFAFSPAEITVKEGQTVIWVNDDSVPHSVKFGSFASPTFPKGGTFQHTFTEAPGDYAYTCGVHPSMAGKVTLTK